mgnify:CR=1 FL=1
MALMDNESDDLAPGQQPTRSAPSSGWNRPLLLAGVGLALMLGGYAAMNYVPSVALTARQAEQERQLTELRELAVKDQPSGTAMDRSFSDRLNQITPPWRSPPYQIPGRLALFGGLFLFVTAGVLMYRHAPPTPTNDDT